MQLINLRPSQEEAADIALVTHGSECPRSFHPAAAAQLCLIGLGIALPLFTAFMRDVEFIEFYNGTDVDFRSMTDVEFEHFAGMHVGFLYLAFPFCIYVGGLRSNSFETLCKYRYGSLIDWIAFVVYFSAWVIGSAARGRGTSSGYLISGSSQWISASVVVLFGRHSTILEQQIRGSNYASFMLSFAYIFTLFFWIYIFVFFIELIVIQKRETFQPPSVRDPMALNGDSWASSVSYVMLALVVAYNFLMYSRYRLDKARLQSLVCTVIVVVGAFIDVVLLALLLGGFCADLLVQASRSPDHEPTGPRNHSLGILRNSIRTAFANFMSLSFILVGPSLWNLILSKVAPTHQQSQFDVFLSHDWGTDESGRNTHSRMAALNDALKAIGLITWFDSDRMQGNIDDRMAEGIDRSKLVIVCITRNYLRKVSGQGARGDDDNCKKEFQYACLRRGVANLMPLVIEEAARATSSWEGPVGLSLGMQLYIDASRPSTAGEFAVIAGQIKDKVQEHDTDKAQ